MFPALQMFGTNIRLDLLKIDILGFIHIPETTAVFMYFCILNPPPNGWARISGSNEKCWVVHTSQKLLSPPSPFTLEPRPKGSKATTVFLYFCIHPTKVLHKNQNIMTNVGCIHILEIVLLPSPPELIFVTHATHGLSVIFLLSLKRIQKSAKSTALGSVYITSVSALFYTQFVILHFLYGLKCVSVKK